MLKILDSLMHMSKWQKQAYEQVRIWKLLLLTQGRWRLQLFETVQPWGSSPLSQPSSYLRHLRRYVPLQSYLASFARLGLITTIFWQTLFSTTFFNFQNTGGKIVSRWIWLYWLITIVLTILTGCAWYWLLRREKNDINLRHQDDKSSVHVIELTERAITVTANSW